MPWYWQVLLRHVHGQLVRHLASRRYVSVTHCNANVCLREISLLTYVARCLASHIQIKALLTRTAEWDGPGLLVTTPQPIDAGGKKLKNKHEVVLGKYPRCGRSAFMVKSVPKMVITNHISSVPVISTT